MFANLAALSRSSLTPRTPTHSTIFRKVQIALSAPPPFHRSYPSTKAWQEVAQVFCDVHLLPGQQQFPAKRPVFLLQFRDSLGKNERLELFLPPAQIPRADSQFRGGFFGPFTAVKPVFHCGAFEILIERPANPGASVVHSFSFLPAALLRAHQIGVRLLMRTSACDHRVAWLKPG